jgi:hypothetical protein
MSIRVRVEDAHILYAIGRPEAALLSLVTAAAATSRKRRPQGTPSGRNPGKQMGDGEAFELFVEDEMPNMCRVKHYNVKYRDEMVRLEHVFWKWLRCELSHAAALPHDIRFEPDSKPGHMSVSIKDDGTLVLSHGWLDALSRVLVAAPENLGEFGDPPSAPLPIHLPKIGLSIGVAPPAQNGAAGQGGSNGPS